MSDADPRPDVPASRDESYFLEAERARWNVDRDVPWDTVDARLAHRQPELLEKLRRAALIEAYHPTNITRELPYVLNDPAATLVLCIEMFEGTRHFYALKRYLDVVGYEPCLTTDDIVRVRMTGGAGHGPHAPDLIVWLVNFMGSEHFASYFFGRLAREAQEPVLRRLLTFIGRDEVRHARAVFRVLQDRVAGDATIAEDIRRAARSFRHYGLDVVSDVPVAAENDMDATLAFLRRVRRLCVGAGTGPRA